MPKYDAWVTYTATQHLQSIEADNVEDAKRIANALRERVNLPHQYSSETDGYSFEEIQITEVK